METKILIADGIKTRVSIFGKGPPLLMFSPGGFDATLEKWSELGLYKKINILNYLRQHFTCISFDRRECGESGGRLEILTFKSYADHGRAILDDLRYESAHVIGGCLGCAPASEFVTLYPHRTESLNLIWPVGGARYRMRNFGRFAAHVGWVVEHGLQALVEKAMIASKGFAKDPTLGPWGSAVKNDASLESSLRSCDETRYAAYVEASYRAMFDCDSAVGPKPEQLMQVRAPVSIIPGDDTSHARSAAYFINECISQAQLLSLNVEDQISDSVFTFFDEFYEF